MNGGGAGVPEGAGGAAGAPPGVPPLQNQTPELITSGLGVVISLVEQYGWFILIGVAVIAYIANKYKPSYESWSRHREDMREAEERKKDPDRSYAVQLSMEQARLRMQETVSANAEVKRMKDAEIAEKKRLEKIEEWERHKQGKGYHSKSATKPDDTNTTNNTLKSKRSKDFRPAYNPLGGDGGGSSGYRPSRSTGRSGGG